MGEKAGWHSTHNPIKDILERSSYYKPPKKWPGVQACSWPWQAHLVEINGLLKEMLCAPGLTWSFEQNFTAQTQTINFYKSAEQLNVTRVWMWIPPARFPHSSSSCPLWDVYSRLSSAQRSCYRVPFQKHSTLLRIKTQPNVSSFFHKTSFKRFFLIYRIF